METIDVHSIANACGLKPSRALTGGVYLMDEDALRAFARTVISSSSVAVDEPAAQDETDSTVYQMPAREQMSKAA